MSKLNPMSGVEHFCDNPQCDKHNVMVPVRSESWWFQHDLKHHHKQLGIRHYRSKLYSGLMVGIHLCGSCYNALMLWSYAKPSPSITGTAGSTEPMCYNPECQFHNKVVYAYEKSVQYSKLQKPEALGTGLGGLPVEKTTYTVIYRTPWFLTCKDGLPQRATTCSICTKALIEFGEGDYPKGAP